MKKCKIYAKTLALQCNKCYAVFSNKTEQLEITLKRKGNEQKGARNE